MSESNQGAAGQSGQGQTWASDDAAIASELKQSYGRLKDELAKVIVGQDEVVEQLLIALFANGHCILEGVPGLAKTLMISSLARCLTLSFNRIQFTPDLMPSDITGTEVIQEDKASGSRTFKFLPGPIFANVILADEINRTPPKTQAALLESMQERHVTVGGNRHDLSLPFFVLATQNPIEQEGTYPLPEAQQDRFMFKIQIGYPSYDEEYTVAEQTTSSGEPDIQKVLSGDEVLRFQQLVRRVPAAPDVIHFALSLVRATRPHEEGSSEFVKKMLNWGAGPRAVQSLILAGKVRAILEGRHHVAIDDIRALAHPILRHRIVTNFSAEAQGYNADRIIDELLNTVSATPTELDENGQVRKVLSA
ncbi:MAG: AAA family ATPase [Phycisphaerae bacterium]